MAKLFESGFLDRISNNVLFNAIQSRIKDVANLGMRYDDQVVKNSQAIGATEGSFLKQGIIGDDAMMYTLAMADIGPKKYIAYFDKDYKTRRDFLRKFSMNGEIQWCLDTISDEAIIQDETQFFCYPATMRLDVKDEVKEKYEENFNKIYNFFHFNDDITAWNYFYQLLVDGFLAFEIIYDDKGAKIIGFKELDPTELRPSVEKQPDGTFKNIWYQNETNINLRRVLYDSQIIYIAYAKGNSLARVSYVERLIRSFNLLRIMEHTRVIWGIMHASFRMKMIVPIGSKSPQKAKESLGELMSVYKEDIKLDYDSGELFVNGRPNIPFYKNYMFPNKNGEQTDIEVMNSGSGPDLNDTAPLEYWYNKLKVDSKIPFARFDKANGGGQFGLGSEGADREEIRFSKFINRLRSIFQEILIKPLYLQMILDFPDLHDDEEFKSAIGLRFNKDNVFERIKEMDVANKTVEFITTMSEIKINVKGTERSYYHPKYLIERYMPMTIADKDLNQKYWDDDDAANDEAGVASEPTEGEEPSGGEPGEEAPDTGTGGFDL
jgi:hypothetical protein